MKPLQLSGVITSMSYCKDESMRIGFTTQELSIEEKNELSKYFQKFGYLLFKENEFQESDIPKIKKYLKDWLGSKIKTTFEFVQEIPLTKSGKRRYFISKVPVEF